MSNEELYIELFAMNVNDRIIIVYHCFLSLRLG